MLIKKNNPLSSILVDELFGDLFAPVNKFKNQVFGPATNVIENEQGITLNMAVPGLNKENINITIENNILTVSYSNESKNSVESENYVRREFEMSQFSRSFSIPSSYDQENITSKLENGILMVSVPKKETKSSKIKSIEIQ